MHKKKDSLFPHKKGKRKNLISNFLINHDQSEIASKNFFSSKKQKIMKKNSLRNIYEDDTDNYQR